MVVWQTTCLLFTLFSCTQLSVVMSNKILSSMADIYSQIELGDSFANFENDDDSIEVMFVKEQRKKERWFNENMLNPSKYAPMDRWRLCEDGNRVRDAAWCHDSHKERILVIDQLPVLGTQLGCGKRMFHFLEALAALGHEVFFAYLRPDPLESEVDRMLMAKLNVTTVMSPLLVGDVKVNYNRALEIARPNVIFMTLWFWQPQKPWFNVPGLLMTYTRQTQTHVKVVVVTDDVHWQRLQMIVVARNSQRATATQSADVQQQSNAELTSAIPSVRMHEWETYKVADAVVTISGKDRALILRHDPQQSIDPSKVFVVPLVASPWETQRKIFVPRFNTRRGLVFVGNLENPTNVEGLRWFLDRVFPAIRRHVPDVVFTVIGNGNWPLRQQHPPDGRTVRFVGWLNWDQMKQELNSARVFVSPIAVSTGVNTKNALAMASGIPLVTTFTGASGLCPTCDRTPPSLHDVLDPSLPAMRPAAGLDGGGVRRSPPLGARDLYPDSPFLCAADEREFARGVVQVYWDEWLWNALSAAGLKNAREFLSSSREAEALHRVLRHVRSSSSSSSSSMR